MCKYLPLYFKIKSLNGNEWWLLGPLLYQLSLRGMNAHCEMARLDLTSCHCPDIYTHTFTHSYTHLIDLSLCPRRCPSHLIPIPGTSWVANACQTKDHQMQNSQCQKTEKTLLHFIQMSTKGVRFTMLMPSFAARWLNEERIHLFMLAILEWKCTIPSGYLFDS